MSGRVGRLFRRYALHHLRLVRPGPGLQAGNGTPLGQVERIELCEGRYLVEGHARATRIALHLGPHQRHSVPVPRPGGQPGFRLALPFGPGQARLVLECADGRVEVPLPGFPPVWIWAGRARLVPGFLVRAGRALPSVRQWFQSRDPAARSRVKRLLGLVAREDHVLDAGVFGAALAGTGASGARADASRAGPVTAGPVDPLSDGPAGAATRAIASPEEAEPSAVTVILSVYNAFEMLAECLQRLVDNTDLPWRLVLVEDASPDPRILPFLRDFAAGRPAGQVTLLENPANLGFIGSVNRGFAHAALLDPLAPVVLLNSDAMVPGGWLPRLLAPMLAEPESVASVTPMSNDAELCTAPVICAAAPVSPAGALEADRVALGLFPAALPAEAPTGVGFCMALNPGFLAKVPQFDPGFGRGYGEEVDWCQRTAALGGRHLIQPGLFVEHRGGSSFGSAEKQRLIARNSQIISRRHPRFDEEVQLFLTGDPLLTARLAIGIGQAGAGAGPDAGLPVYLAHSLGGGAEHWLARQIAGHIQAGPGGPAGPDVPPGTNGGTGAASGSDRRAPLSEAAPNPGGSGAALVLRVGGERRWRLELHTSRGVTAGATDDFALIRRLLEPLPRRRVIYSCGVGDSDPVGLPGALLELVARPQDRLEILFHDYFPLSPSYTLLDRDGGWHGLPHPGQARDPAHTTLRADGSRVDLAGWRAEWDRLGRRADRLVVFSGSSRDLVTEAWPWAGARLDLVPHALPPLPPRLVPEGAVPLLASGQKPVIGILGNVGSHKGAALVSELSRKLSRDRQAGLVVVGEFDPAYRLIAPARAHGPYRIADLPQIVARYGITTWLVPTICAETFSFTTREVLATGLPVYCLDLGAQAEAVRSALAAGAPGGLIPLSVSGSGLGSMPVSDLADRVLGAVLAPDRRSD